MWLIFLLSCAMTWSTFGEYTKCPQQCHCHTHTDEFRTSVQIRCTGSRIPDLSPLTSDTQVKELVFDAYKNGNVMSVRRNMFSPGLRIRSLVVKVGRSTMFSDGCFGYLNDYLESLRIGNEVTFNSTLTFLKGLTNLKQLYLANNKQYWTRENDSEVVSLFRGLGLHQLTHLYMPYCFIYRMSEAVFSGVEGVIHLDLSGNRLSHTPRALDRLSHLRYLDLSFNSITNLGSSSFSKLKNLETLRLAGNEFGELQNDAFFGLEHSLLTLDLQMTKQNLIPTVSLQRLSALKNLNISENPFTDMPANSLRGDYCLRRLDMHYTDVDFHSSMFEGQTDCIRVLSLYRPKVNYIPNEAIASLTDLHVLEFQGADVKVIKSNALRGIKAKVLDLSFLPVTHIEEGAFDHLEIPLELILMETSLTSLSFVLDYPRGLFSRVDIGGSLMCGCDLVVPLNHLGCVLHGICSNPDDFQILELNDFNFQKNVGECNVKLIDHQCSMESLSGGNGVVSDIFNVLTLFVTHLFTQYLE